MREQTRWHDDEVAALTRLWMEERRSLPEVAAALGRPWASVKLKIYALRLVRGDRNDAAWTDDQSEELKRRFAAGETFQEIATALGVTRSACTGKAKRLGLAGRRRGRRSSGVKAAKPRRPAKAARRTEAAAAPLGPYRDAHPSLNLTLLELEPGQCRWPYGEGPFLFCGHAVQGELASYCPHHMAVAYLPPEEGQSAAREVVPHTANTDARRAA